MTERAERRLTLTTRQESLIHALCATADSAVWALKYGDEESRILTADDLSAAWKAVGYGVMP